MRKEAGDRNFEIWLLGDSNPEKWQDVLDTPLDPRHPARHSIWTPVLEVIQDRVFRECGDRVDTSLIYIRNAIEDPANKPHSSSIEWNTNVEKEMRELQKIVREYRPKILLCFGAFSFEFTRRALTPQAPKRNWGHWGSEELGCEFRQRISQFDLNTTNVLPLLHVSIARKFITSHDYFCNQKGANYFEFVGNHIAQKLVEHHGELRIWIE